MKATDMLARQSTDTDIGSADYIAKSIEDDLAAHDDPKVLGDTLHAIITKHAIPRRHAIRGALVSDFARVAYAAIEADAHVSEEEQDYCFPIFYALANFLATIRPEYHDFEDLSRRDLLRFLLRFKNDDRCFGYACEATQWIGLELCRRVARATGDREPLELHGRALNDLMEDVFALGGTTTEELQEKQRLQGLIEVRKGLVADERDEGVDPRVKAFCAPTGPAVFSAIVRSHQVWERDPFDVETVHAEARETFARMLDRLASDDGNSAGRILLIRGESGAGKTHLMRALRNHVHAARAGFAGYMQMSSRSDDYARYALANLIDALERPYDAPDLELSGAMMLSNALAETEGILDSAALEQLREDDFDLAREDHVSPLVDHFLSDRRFSDFDPDLLRVILYLQRGEPKIRVRVLKYLRCEPLTPYDCDLLGRIAPRTDRGAPQRMLSALGRLMWQAGRFALVLLVDQLEDIVNLDDANARIPRTMDVLRQLVDDLPSAIVVISCLDDLYDRIRGLLSRPTVDRIEMDPPPVQLSSTRSSEEIEALVALRLSVLYDAFNVRFRADDPVYPFSRRALASQSNRRARDVLDWCFQVQQRCIAAGRIVDADTVVEPSKESGHDRDSEASVELDREWDDFRAAFSGAPPDDDAPLLAILQQAIEHVADEFDPAVPVCCVPMGDILEVRVGEQAPASYAVAMANSAAQGGRLMKDVDRLHEQAGARRLALVRRSDYPSNPKTKTVQRLGELVRAGARKLVCEDADLRTMMAFSAFSQRQAQAAGFARWRRRSRPLSNIRALRELLDLEHRERAAASPPQPELFEEERDPAPGAANSPASTPAPSTPVHPSAPEARTGSIHLGVRAGLARAAVELPLSDLRTHAAFLGSTGSGKTTVALNIIEQALLQRVPVVMVDRKGDLCTYARERWWAESAPTPQAQATKQALAAGVSIDVFTPGEFEGRHLGLPLFPSTASRMKSHELNTAAMQSATALGAMAGFRPRSRKDQTCVTILGKAIELLATIANGEVTLARLIRLIAEADPALVDAIGHLDDKYFKDLVEALELLRIQHGRLLEGGTETFDPTHVFAPTVDGRTKLTIVSTKFLRDSATTEFWIARMLTELSQWASRNPANDLQALIMFDEADIYMPAQAKPATKEPMQDLLKRARSAGLGVFLCTQSPGDLDYRSRDNIRAWFLGRIAEGTAVNKMRPLLTDARTNIDKRLSRQAAGEFFVLRAGHVTELRADRSVMDTEQVPEDEIVALARASRDR